jgi:hypothetical protein
VVVIVVVIVAYEGSAGLDGRQCQPIRERLVRAAKPSLMVTH